MDASFEVFVIVGILIIVFVVWMILSSKKTESNWQVLKDYGIVVEGDSGIRIERKGSKLGQLIKITKVTDVAIGHEPEKIHIGSATVGGVTTGGVYKTGGYNYYTGASYSGKYVFWFGTKSNGHEITRIFLSQDLYKKAETSSIAKYLNSMTRSIELVDVHTKYTDLELAELKMFAYGQAGTSHALHKAYPTYEKCAEILNWLTCD